MYCRAVVSGGAGGTLAPPEFGRSVNPIPTRGGRLCPPHYCQHPRIRKPNDSSEVVLEMLTLCRFSLMIVMGFIHKWQLGVGRWSVMGKILSTQFVNAPQYGLNALSRFTNHMCRKDAVGAGIARMQKSLHKSFKYIFPKTLLMY